MKKTSTLLLISMFTALLVFTFTFTGCEKLKIDNLKANDHLNKANKHYSEEKFLKAVQEYEEALKLNPKLTKIYFYAGTAYASLYRPGRDTEKNKNYGLQAVDYLLKAYEAEPENDQIVLSLGDIYDKMENFEEAEKYYLKIMEKDNQNAKSYYILADFYSKYNKEDEANNMYLKRIELDPKDPEAYLYYANYLQKKRKWYEAMDAFESMIIVQSDPEIQMMRREVKEIAAKLEQIDKKEKFLKLVKKNRRISAEEKKRITDEKTAEIEAIGNKEEMTKAVDEKRQLVASKIEGLKDIQDQLEDEAKQKLAESYYSLGVATWFKSFQTATEMMSSQERKNVIDRGMKALDRSIELNAAYSEPWAYKNLLWREMIKVEPLKRDEFLAKAKSDAEKFARLRKRQLALEEKMKQLEKLGAE